jgi:vitamin B12 transporter
MTCVVFCSSSVFVHPNSRRARLSAGAALGVIALALGTTPARSQAVEIPQITVYANQAPTDVGKAGAVVTVLSGSELRSKGFSTAADALRTVPGVAISQAGGRGALTQTRIRGSESNHVLVLIDDVPVNDFSNGDFNFADFALEDVERIEVVRGPQSGIYGANAHAGVISIVTKSGRGLKKPQASLRVEGGSRNTGAFGGSVRGAAGLAYGSISIDHNRTSGYNVSRLGDERESSHALTTTAKVGVDFTPTFNVEGAVRSAKRYAETDSQPFAGPLSGLAEDSPADLNRSTGTNARVAATWALFDGALVQRLGASRYSEARRDDDHVLGPFGSEGTRDNFDYKATLTGETSAVIGARHTVTALIDKQVEAMTMTSGSFDPTTAAFWAGGPSRTRKGMAGEYAIDLQTGTTLTGAVRHDRNSGFDDLTTWRITASQQIRATGTRLHASAGTGATNPNFIEQFGFFPSFFIGNPNLRPERSRGWDAGIEQRFFDGRLVTDVTYFGSDFDDKIQFVNAGGGFLTTVVNLAGVSPRRGVETTARLDPVDWLTLTASYTFTSAKLPDGTPEIRRPRHAAAGSATVHFADRRGRATVNVVYNGTMPDTWFRTPLTAVMLDAYTVLGGVVEYDVAPFATAYLRAENVFDNDYEEVFSYRAPGFGVFAGMKLRLE